MKNISKRHNKEKGITLFVAILITGTLLLISVAIVSLAVKEAFLSSTYRDSQYAFYAADTGAECAIYWDVNNPNNVSAFATSTQDSMRTISCLGNSMLPTRVVSGGYGTSTFHINYQSEPYCADVLVSKNADGTTKIESLGYNNCTSNPRRVQRAVRVTY
jgi:Tfp pilus assembly protein PilX